MRRVLYYLHFTNMKRLEGSKTETFLSEYSQCPFWLKKLSVPRQMSMNVQRTTNNSTDIKATIHKRNEAK